LARVGVPPVRLVVGAAVLMLLVCQRLVQVWEQAQCPQSARGARLARRLRHGRSRLERSAGTPRFVAQLEFGVAIERVVHPLHGMRRKVLTARMSAEWRVPTGALSVLPLAAARAMLLRVTVQLLEATRSLQALMTALPVRAAPVSMTVPPVAIPERTNLRVAKSGRMVLTRMSSASAFALPEVQRSAVEKLAQAQWQPWGPRSGP
jgi:hypothetical protein